MVTVAVRYTRRNRNAEVDPPTAADDPINVGRFEDVSDGRVRCFLFGATGFEPATSRSRTVRSSQTELRPVVCVS
jgi:hypothetical protein